MRVKGEGMMKSIPSACRGAPGTGMSNVEFTRHPTRSETIVVPSNPEPSGDPCSTNRHISIVHIRLEVKQHYALLEAPARLCGYTDPNDVDMLALRLQL